MDLNDEELAKLLADPSSSSSSSSSSAAPVPAPAPPPSEEADEEDDEDEDDDEDDDEYEESKDKSAKTPANKKRTAAAQEELDDEEESSKSSKKSKTSTALAVIEDKSKIVKATQLGNKKRGAKPKSASEKALVVKQAAEMRAASAKSKFTTTNTALKQFNESNVEAGTINKYLAGIINPQEIGAKKTIEKLNSIIQGITAWGKMKEAEIEKTAAEQAFNEANAAYNAAAQAEAEAAAAAESQSVF